MVILKHLQVKSQTSSYLGQPPTRIETFSTKHIKTSLLSHFIINKTYLIQILSQLMFTNFTIAKTKLKSKIKHPVR